MACIAALLGAALAACSGEAPPPQPGTPKPLARPALLSHEARIVADAELKRRNLIGSLVAVEATVATQYAELARCRVVHHWLLTYQATGAVVTVSVGLDDAGKGVAGTLKEDPPAADAVAAQPIQGWNFGAEEAAAAIAREPGMACSASLRSFTLRMEAVEGRPTPVWRTPYDAGGRRVAVDAGTGRLLEEQPAPAGESRVVLAPLAAR
jgi:hypothetical protein